MTVTSGYDAANQLTSTTFPGGSISQVYDALGRRMSMTDPLGTTTYRYDSASNVTSVVAPQGTVGYTYDAAGQRASMTLPGSRTITYTYDAGNQLTSLSDWLGQKSTFSYTADGLLSGVSRPGGLQTSHSYDAADRVTSVNSDGPGGALRHFSYTLDANGNRTSVTSGAGTESYTLDALNRITSASYPNGDKATYTYDAVGNRTSQTVNGVTTSYTYDAGGRLVQAGAVTYAYDAAGDLIGAGADSFAWDWAGRLAQATVSGTTSSYNYDGDGTRVGAQVGSTRTSYLWDRQSAVPLLVDDGSHGYVQSSGAGPLEQLTSGGASAALYPLPDALGSVRGLANASGSLAGSSDYDVFGAVRSSSGGSSVFGFTGQQTDATTLLYLHARYLSTGLGRFLTPDSVFPDAPGTQGYNLYAYAGNNPTTLVDPTGHEAAAEYAFNLEKEPPPNPWLGRAIIGVIILVVLALGDCALAVIPATHRFSICQGFLGNSPGSDTGPTNDPNVIAQRKAELKRRIGMAVTSFKEVDGAKNAQGYYKPRFSIGDFRPDVDGVSSWELPFLRGFKPYILPFLFVITPGTYTFPLVQPAGCNATYTPEYGIGHWSINCLTDTQATLFVYAQFARDEGLILPNPKFKDAPVKPYRAPPIQQ